MTTPVPEFLKLFELDSGGPNPYYRCKCCGAVEPGLLEYLEAHAKSCPNPSEQYTK
jgi:hypothetical protein